MWSSSRTCQSFVSCGCRRRCSSGRHVRKPASTWFAAREVHDQRVRRFTLYADGDPIAELPVTIRVLPGGGPDDRARHDAARREDRGGARRRGTGPPRWTRRRHEPSRQGTDGARTGRDLGAVGAPAARLGRDLGHQRQDDDRRDGRLGAETGRRSRVVHNRAGANMAGGVASTLLAAARGGGRIDGELGLFEVDEFWLDRVDRAARTRARSCSATCSAISSTATASSRRSPTAGQR